MKKITLFTFVAILAMAFIGCQTTKETNSNHAVVINSSTNANMALNSNMMNSNMAVNTNNATGTGTSSRYNTNMTRAEYEKNQADYEADRTGSTIGKGANDSWIWFKTKAALATTNDLRDSTINVDVNNDVVTLKGTVASKAEADKAISVAKGIEGVKNVNSVLKIQPNDSMTNQMTGGNTNTKMTNSNANMKK
jgi:hyperosmotically inducible protein